MKAYITTCFWSGLGDAYSAYASVYVAALDLEKMGYDVTFVWDTSRASYIQPNSRLDNFFESSMFKNPVEYNIQDTLINSGMYTLLPNQQKSFNIYVDTVSEELKNYRSIIYVPNHMLHHRLKYPFPEIKFFKQEIYDIADKAMPDKRNMKGIHFRLPDEIAYHTLDAPDQSDRVIPAIYANESWKGQLGCIRNYIEKNLDKKILLCSNNLAIREHIAKDYTNVIYFDYSHKEYQQTYWQVNWITHKPTPQLVAKLTQKVKETYAETILLGYCEEIHKICNWHSTFLSYALLHGEYNLSTL